MEEAIAHAQKALIYARLKQWQEADQEYDLVISLAESAGDKACAAINYYGKAIVLFHLPQKRPETQKAIKSAISIANEIGYYPLAAKSYHFLANLQRETGDLLGAFKSSSRAVRLISKAEPSAVGVQILQTRASTYSLLGQFEQAKQDLDRALNIAKQIGNTHLAYSVQLDRQFLKNLTTDEDFDTSQHFLQELLAQAQKSGTETIAGDINLYLSLIAAEKQDWSTALELATEARQQALNSTDPQRYLRFLASSIAIAQALEALDDKIGVLDTLLTCKKTLETSVGKEVSQLIMPFLDGLSVRWGQKVFERVFRIHQNRMRVRSRFNDVHIISRSAKVSVE